MQMLYISFSFSRALLYTDTRPPLSQDTLYFSSIFIKHYIITIFFIIVVVVEHNNNNNNIINYNFVSVLFFLDYRSTPFAQRPGMAENVRRLLSFADKQSAELHGGKNDSIKKHDVRLV